MFTQPSKRNAVLIELVRLRKEEWQVEYKGSGLVEVYVLPVC